MLGDRLKVEVEGRERNWDSSNVHYMDLYITKQTLHLPGAVHNGSNHSVQSIN